MPETGETVTPLNQARRLSDAVRDVKNALADRDDVVVDMREAHRMRLELLAAELAPIFAEVPADVDYFDFAVDRCRQPCRDGPGPPLLPLPEGHPCRSCCAG